MRGMTVVLCVALWMVAVVLPACITTSRTLEDGTVVTTSRINWDEVAEAIARLQPYVRSAMAAAQEWQEACEARDAAQTAYAQELRDRQVALVGSATAYVYVYQRDVRAGVTARQASLNAVASANQIISLLGVENVDFVELARDVIYQIDKPDYPSDVDLALMTLRETLPDLLAPKGGV